MKYYFAVIHKDDDSAYGVTFPDVPGCFSAGDSHDEAIENAKEALRLYAEQVGKNMPEPSSFQTLIANKDIRREAKNAPLVGVPLLLDAGRTVRVNITLDAGLLEAVDQAAEKSDLTRSAFLAEAARAKIR